MSYDFGALERLWQASIEEALSSSELDRGERLNAIAFWLFYAEHGSVISPPLVGLGVETARGRARIRGDWQDAPRDGKGRDVGYDSLRWNPADWEYDILELPNAEAIDAAYTALATDACGMAPEEARRAAADPARDARWESYFEKSIDAVIAVSRELTRRAHARTGAFADWPLADHFVATICSPNQGDDGEEWLRRCVDEPLFSALFPDLSEPAGSPGQD